MGFRRSSRSKATIINNGRHNGYNKWTYYMLEISKFKKTSHTCLSEIKEVIRDVIKPIVDISHECYELGYMYSQLHCHMIGRVPKGFRYRNFTKYNGFHIRWTKINDYVGAVRYTTKEQDKQSQSIDENDYRHQYAFI